MIIQTPGFLYISCTEGLVKYKQSKYKDILIKTWIQGYSQRCIK